MARRCSRRGFNILGAGLPLAAFDTMTRVTGAAEGRARTAEPKMPDKRLNVAVVMDPIEDIKPAKDTTLAMMLAAQRRGWELAYVELGHMWLRDGVAMARTHSIEVRDDPHDWFTRGEPRIERLGGFDSILMRKDPPFDTEYIYSTYIL